MFDSNHINAEMKDGVAVVAIKCEKVGEYETPIIQTEIAGFLGKQAWKLALNFKDVRLLASVGLGLLVTLHKQCKANKGKLAIFGLDDNLRGLLKMTKLDSGLCICGDEAAAAKAVG